MVERVFAFAIHAEVIPRAGRALIAHIAPEPRGLGLVGLQLALQLNRRVIGKERGACPEQFTNMIGQWFQKGRAAPDPIGQGRARQVHVLAGKGFGLSLERQVIGVFANQNMGQKTRAGASAFNRAGWQRGLGKSLAAGAGHTWADNPAHDKASGDILQFFGNILADLAQGATAVPAFFCGMRQSIPSSSIDSWDGLMLTLPFFAAGHTNRPRSSRFENRHAPC